MGLSGVAVSAIAAGCGAGRRCSKPRTTARAVSPAKTTVAARQRARPANLGVVAAAAGCSSAAGDLRPRRGAAGEDRDVAALRNLDQDRIGLARDEVVALQRAAQPPGLGPHHRVRLGVEALVALEHRGGDGVALQTVRVPGEGLLHDVAQEAARALGDHELGAAEDARELITHLVGQWRRQRLPGASPTDRPFRSCTADLPPRPLASRICRRAGLRRVAYCKILPSAGGQQADSLSGQGIIEMLPAWTMVWSPPRDGSRTTGMPWRHRQLPMMGGPCF